MLFISVSNVKFSFLFPTQILFGATHEPPYCLVCPYLMFDV